MRYEVLIAGMGGQGVILAGTVIGTAITVFGGKSATQIASYGPEARGGRVYTQLVISDGEVDYPLVRRPDIVIAMSQRAFDEFARRVREGGLVIFDEDLVEPRDAPSWAELTPIPATRVADGLGLRRSANMVMVGVLTAVCELLEPDAVREAIRYRLGHRYLDINLKAFELGYQLGLRFARGRR